MRILVIKFRNIGDILLSTPLLENLKLNYPDAQIDYALNANCSEMLTLNPNMNNLFEYDRNKIKSKNILFRIIEEIKYIKNIIENDYDLVINLTEGDRGSFIAMLSKAKIKLGYKPRKGILKYLNIYDKIAIENQNVHAIEKDLQFITLLNKKIKNKKVSIYWSNSDTKKVDKILEKNNIVKFIHIHPVSRWMFKCWEDDRMAKVIDYFETIKNIKVIITASNDEKEKAKVEYILSLCDSHPIDLTGQLSLKELAYLSSKSSLFFGVDSAPMHIAAAVNTTVVSLFGGSFSNIWAPWDNNLMKSKFLHTNGIQKSGIHSIVSNIDFKIYYENDIKKCQGMTNIKYNDVIKVLNEK